jgi:putative ABC transport system permease protein
MFTWFRQTLAVTLLSLQTIPQRLGSSAVAVIGIAGVVVVFVSVLSIGVGFRAAMTQAGSPLRALVMRSGADSEMTSGIAGTDVDIIKQAPGILRDHNQPIASAELFVIVDVNKKSTNTSANVPLRGVEPTTLQVHDEVKLVDGRMLQFGTNEAIVGRAASGQFKGLNVGSDIQSGQLTLKIVGMFEAAGSVAETEIWTDAKILQGAYRRNNSYQSVLVRLDSASSYDVFKNWLTSNPQLNVEVRHESEYYEAQSASLTRLITTLGYGIASLMGLGAVFGSMLTMYTAVSTRTREIATLRALGFNTSPVLLSVFIESMTLGVIGGAIGGGVAYLAFNGFQTSTLNWQTFSQVAFSFRVTVGLLTQGLVWALAMGFIGGLFPAIRAATLPIPKALREL